MKARIKLSWWSTMCLLLTTVLDSLRPPTGTPVELLWLVVLIVLPGLGAALGIMSLRREERTSLMTLLSAINLILALGGVLRLILTFSPA